MVHHAYVVVGDNEAGVEAALRHAKRELGLANKNNPDVIVLNYGLLSVDDARKIITLAQQSPIAGSHKAIILSASRIYHEAQNALLKLFEEPPAGTTLYLALPGAGLLLPTLRSRVVIMETGERSSAGQGAALDFARAGKDARTALIKKLTSGTDDEERRQNREEALALTSGLEALAAEKKELPGVIPFLNDIALLRGYLNDRSAPVKLILEHLSLALPKGIGSKLS